MGPASRLCISHGPRRDLCPVRLLGRRKGSRSASLFAKKRLTAAHCAYWPKQAGEERHIRVL